MNLKHVLGGLLLASATGLAVVSMPQTAQANPPGGCPPGLAKKHTDCMPPGQYKKYHRGDYIHDWQSYDRVRCGRYGLRSRDGYSCIRIGNEAYLIAEATQRVIEAINLLSR